MQAWVLGEAVNGPPTYGSFPPSLSVAAISREMGDGRLTSEMYFARSPSAEHTDVPRACYPALPMESSVYSISPCLTGPNPPTKKRAISAGEFRSKVRSVLPYCRCQSIPFLLVTFFGAMIARLSTVPRRESIQSAQYRVCGIYVALGAAPARRGISRRQIA